MADDVVANYYGLADRTESGFRFVPIKHENENLGGILTQAGFCRAYQTAGNRTRSNAGPGSRARSSPNRRTIRLPMFPSFRRTTGHN